MAEKRTINIDINSNASEAEKDFKSFNKAVDETTKSAKNLDATFEEVYGELQPLTTRMGEAEDRLYELALAGDTASKEYQELLTKVGEYRKVQIQTDLAVDGAAQTMTQKLGSALNGATSGFAATQGAMALFGSENQALEKSLLKVQSALAIQQGVDGLRTSYKELGGATGIATKAQAVFNFVMNLNPIALIVTGITLAIAALLKFTSFLDPAIQGLKDFGDAIGLTSFAEKEREDARVKSFEEEGKRHKAAMDNASKEIAAIDKQISKEKERQKALEDTYNLELRKAEGNAEKIEEINKNLAKSKKDSIDEEQRLFIESKLAQIKQEEAGIAVFQAVIDANIARGRTDHAKEVAEVAKRTARLTALKKKALENDYDEIQSFNVRRENLDLDYEDGVDDRLKARNEKYKQYVQERLRISRQIEDIENGLLEDGIEKELEINRDKFRILREDVKGNREERKKLLDLYDQQEAQAEAKIIADNQKRREDAFETERSQRVELLNFVDELNTAEVESEKAKNLAIIESSKDAAAKQKEIDEKAAQEKADRQNAQIDLAVQGFQLIAGIAEAFAGEDVKRQKKAFEIKKVADIAAATVDGYRAVLSTYAQTPGGPVIKGIAAGLAGSFAALQIANIAKQQFQGGGDGADVSVSADAGGAGTEAAVPQFNVVGDSGINQIAQLQQQPVQAFVVSGEVTTSQALDRNRVQNATL
jgi:hypothetical protein